MKCIDCRHFTPAPAPFAYADPGQCAQFRPNGPGRAAVAEAYKKLGDAPFRAGVERNCEKFEEKQGRSGA